MNRTWVDSGMNPTVVTAAACVPSSFTVMVLWCLNCVKAERKGISGTGCHERGGWGGMEHLIKTHHQAWQWCTPLTPALGRQRQAELCQFEASLVYKS